MIRFLLHANDMEVVAIIQTNSIFQRGGWSNAGWIEKQLDAYEQVYPNLIVHDPAYPTAFFTARSYSEGYWVFNFWKALAAVLPPPQACI